MKKYVCLIIILMTFAIPLSACVPENYTKDQKEAVLTKGQDAIEKWLSENESDANLIECEIEEGGYRSLSSLVSGTYERDGEIYDCYCETLSGQIYTSELNKNLAELLADEVSKAVVPENDEFSVKVRTYVNVGYIEKGDNIQNISPDSTTFVNGFPVDADDSVYASYKDGILSGDTKLVSVTFHTDSKTEDFADCCNTDYLFETKWINEIYLICSDGEIHIYKSTETISEEVTDSSANSETSSEEVTDSSANSETSSSDANSKEVEILYFNIDTDKEYIYPEDENIKFLYEDSSEYVLKKSSDTYEKKVEDLTDTTNFKYLKTSDGFKVCGEKLYTICFKNEPETDKLKHQIGSSHYEDSIVQNEDGWYKLVVGRDSELIASIGEGEMIEFEWVS